MGPSKGGGPKGGGPKPRKSGAPKGGAPKGGAPKGGAPKGGAPKGGGPKISRFFFPPPPQFSFYFLSLGVLSWNFGGVRSAGALICARLEFSGCRVRAPAARSGGAAGVSHDCPRAQMCTFQGPGLQKHQQKNSTKGPQNRERRMKIVAGGGKKKSKILGGPAEGCPAEGCPAEGCPAEGGSPEGGVQRKGPSEMGCRVLGFLGFSSGFWGRKQKQNKNKMKREMSKNK